MLEPLCAHGEDLHSPFIGTRLPELSPRDTALGIFLVLASIHQPRVTARGHGQGLQRPGLGPALSPSPVPATHHLCPPTDRESRELLHCCSRETPPDSSPLWTPFAPCLHPNVTRPFPLPSFLPSSLSKKDRLASPGGFICSLLSVAPVTTSVLGSGFENPTIGLASNLAESQWGKE